ncbi:MAG: DUF4346 domain-containing protein [Verrucomicrobiae bacterium]|nr:DUF4346 domain-containing protein [Verrucomicrobiae bacterium]
MKRQLWWMIGAGTMVFAAHAAWYMAGASVGWAYFQQHDYWLGLSYAVAAVFVVYSWQRVRQRQRGGVAGMVGGLTWAGALYWTGCWLLGCCGSPLLPVYLGLFGATVLDLAKPLVLIVTLASVAIGVWWMRRAEARGTGCGCGPSACGAGNQPTSTGAGTTDPVEEIRAELAEGMNLPKCQQCGCMGDALQQIRGALPDLASDVAVWQTRMKPIKYACLGCAHCYPAVAMNTLHRAFPELAGTASLSCEFEVRDDIWPPVPGEYHTFCEGDSCPVAVSTLASVELAETLARRRPRALCIVGKTETENIGIDKLIKNTITNRTIRYLVVAGREPQGHATGQTLLALAANGVDDSMRVVGSPGKRPILRNVTRDEVEQFRRQVQVVDMIGCEDAAQIEAKLAELASAPTDSTPPPAQLARVPVIRAEPPAQIEMDRAGYFVIVPRADRQLIVVEHYDYNNQLLRVIEGRDARSLYSTIIQNGWVTQLSHAAYLGKELARAETALQRGEKYIQDGA